MTRKTKLTQIKAGSQASSGKRPTNHNSYCKHEEKLQSFEVLTSIIQILNASYPILVQCVANAHGSLVDDDDRHPSEPASQTRAVYTYCSAVKVPLSGKLLWGGHPRIRRGDRQPTMPRFSGSAPSSTGVPSLSSFIDHQKGPKSPSCLSAKIPKFAKSFPCPNPKGFDPLNGLAQRPT